MMDATGFVLEILIESWEVLAESAPYLLFGFLAAGVLCGLIGILPLYAGVLVIAGALWKMGLGIADRRAKV